MFWLRQGAGFEDHPDWELSLSKFKCLYGKTDA